MSLPVQLLLSLIQMSISPWASSEASVMQPLQMDHRTAEIMGLTPPVYLMRIINNQTKPNTLAPKRTPAKQKKKPTTKQNHTKHIQPKPEKHSSFWKIYSVTQKVPIWGLFCWQNCKSWEGPWWEGNIVSPAPASPGFHCISCGPFRTSNQQFLPLPMAVFLRSTNINADAINMSVYISVSNSAMLIEWLSVHFIMH